MTVVNPISGNINKTEICNHIEKVNDGRFSISFFKTTGDNDKEKLEKEINKDEFDRVIVLGGDGTIQLVASVILDKNIELGIIPCGSSNGLASNFNIPENRKKQIQLALGDKVQEMDCIIVNDQVCIHITDLGLNAELIKHYEKSRMRGKTAYIFKSFFTLFQADYPYDFVIEINDKKIHRKGIFLGVTNFKDFGMGARINPEAKISDGFFEIVIFKKLSVKGIIKTFFKTTHLDNDNIEHFSVKKARIICETKPINMQIDGEFVGKTRELNVKVSEQKLLIAH